MYICVSVQFVPKGLEINEYANREYNFENPHISPDNARCGGWQGDCSLYQQVFICLSFFRQRKFLVGAFHPHPAFQGIVKKKAT